MYATGRSRHAFVIFFLFCTSGFPLLSLKHSCYGHECGMDVRPGFGSFSMRHSLFTETICTEQLRIVRHLCYFDRFIRRKKKGYNYSRFPYYSNRFQSLTSSLFAATAISIPIQVHRLVIGIWDLAVRGTTWRMQILSQMYLSFTPTQGVWLTRLISWN